MSEHKADEVQDTSGARYTLGRRIGSGGQGEVFTVKGRPLAIKRLYARGDQATRRLNEGIARVRRLPLSGLHVAQPLRALASPEVGYVMELMTEMIPLSELMTPPPAAGGEISEWYVETGSLKRRLRCLTRCAELLATLHGRGLTFGDLSGGNVVISEDPALDIVWLIDTDNLTEGAAKHTLHTPGYGAPELFRGHGADSLTDAWSFAVLAFETLCVLHPFIGDDVHDGDPALEEQAWRGELPWVDDPSEENFASRGLPRSLVLTPQLQRLAEGCFGESRLERRARPGVAAWAQMLRRAASQVLVCPGCRSSYYLNQTPCPWCADPRPVFATVIAHLRDPALTDPARNPFNLVCIAPGQPKTLERAVLQGGHPLTLGGHLLGAAMEAHPLHLSLEGQILTLKGDAGCPYDLKPPRGPLLSLDGAARSVLLEPGGKPWWILPKAQGDLHRALRLDLHPGGAS